MSTDAGAFFLIDYLFYSYLLFLINFLMLMFFLNCKVMLKKSVYLRHTKYLCALIYFWWGFYSSGFVNKSSTKINRNTNMNCKLFIIPSTEKLDKISTIPEQILSTIYFSSLFHSAIIINYRLVLYLRQPSPSSEVQ